MERIGIAASKMAKGNLFSYNCWVVLIAFLFSALIFIVAGSTVLFALVIISYMGSEVMAFDFQGDWGSLLKVCMVTLTVIVTLFTLAAISKNLKMPQHHKNGS